MKNTNINIRCSDDERALIRALREQEHLSSDSEYIRLLIYREADKNGIKITSQT